MLILIFSCVWKQFSITILEVYSFLKSRLANRGPEVFSNRVLLNSGCALVVWTTWPPKRYWGGLTLFSLLLIAQCYLHWHASPWVCDWQAITMKLPNSCSGKHVCTWLVCTEPLISVWKVCNSKRYCETRFTNAITNEIFLPSENAIWIDNKCQWKSIRNYEHAIMARLILFNCSHFI